MHAKLSAFYQAIQIYLQQNLVIVQEEREVTNFKIKCRLTTANHSLEKELEVISKLEKTCKKVQMRNVSLCSPTGLAELALMDRLVLQLKWMRLTARNEGRVNHELYRSRAARLGDSAAVLERCIQAYVEGNQTAAVLWASADQLCLRASSGGINASVGPSSSGLPKEPSELPSLRSDLSTSSSTQSPHSQEPLLLLRSELHWRDTQWAHCSIVSLLTHLKGELPEHLIKKADGHSAQARVAADVAQEFQHIIKLQSTIGLPSCYPVVRRLQEATTTFSLARVEVLAAVYRTADSTSGATDDCRDSEDARRIAFMLQLGAKLEERLAWRDRLVVVLPSVVEHKEVLQAMVDVCSMRCDVLVQQALQSAQLPPWLTSVASCELMLQFFTTMPLPGPAMVSLAEQCASKRNQLRQQMQRERRSEPHFVLAESVWASAYSSFGRYFAHIGEVLRIEGRFEDNTAESALVGLTAAAETEMVQARNHAHCAAGMCQDALTYHSRAERLRSGSLSFSQLDPAELAQVWDKASNKMLSAARVCYDQTGSLEFCKSKPILRHFADAAKPEAEAVSYAQLGDVMQRCGLASSPQEQEALQRVAVLTGQRILHEESVATAGSGGGPWKPQHERCLALLQRVLTMAQKASSPIFLRGTYSNGVVVQDRHNAPDLVWTVPVLVEYSTLLLRAASTIFEESERWKASAAMDTLRTAVEKVYDKKTAQRERDCKRHVLLLLRGVDAHLQGLRRRGALLMNAAEFSEKSTEWGGSNVSVADALYSLSDQLLKSVLPQEEIQQHIEARLAHLEAHSLYSPWSNQEPVKPFLVWAVEACAARADVLAEREAQFASLSAAGTMDASSGDLIANAALLYGRLINQLSNLVEQRLRIHVKESKTITALVRVAQTMQQSAQRYWLAARALQQGQVELSKHWRMSAEFSEQLGSKMKVDSAPWQLLEVAAYRCARAAESLSAGAETAAALYWRTAANASARTETSSTVHDLQVADCAQEISEALAQNKAALAGLWQSLRAQLDQVRLCEAAVAQGPQPGASRPAALKALDKARLKMEALRTAIAAAKK